MRDSQDSPVDPRLIESEERYRAVIDNASDMIQSVRPDGTFEFVNPAWLRTLGHAADEVPGLTIWDTIHPDSLAHCQELFALAIAGQPLENFRAIFKTKAGAAVPVEGDVVSRVVAGKVVATHGFFRDISARLRAQELEERAARLEREKQARYLEKMAALGKLAAGLSHELNNPAAAAQRASDRLAASLVQRDAAAADLIAQGLSQEQWRVLGALATEAEARDPAQRNPGPLEISRREEAVEAWLDDHGVEGSWKLAPGLVQAGVTEAGLARLADCIPAPAHPAAVGWIAAAAEARSQTDVIAQSTRRISELVGAVKAYTFMDRAAEQVVDVHEGIENTLVILAHRLKNVSVRRDYGQDVPVVRAFGSGLNQVWTNIIDNAIDAVGGAGSILIRTRNETGDAAVEIIDDGCGIPEEQLSRIFEPFFTTKPQGQGTGLGLDTAWRIVTDEHRGRIDVESAPGATRFRVVVPASERGAPAAG